MISMTKEQFAQLQVGDIFTWAEKFTNQIYSGKKAVYEGDNEFHFVNDDIQSRSIVEGELKNIKAGFIRPRDHGKTFSKNDLKCLEPGDILKSNCDIGDLIFEGICSSSSMCAKVKCGEKAGLFHREYDELQSGFTRTGFEINKYYAYGGGHWKGQLVALAISETTGNLIGLIKTNGEYAEFGLNDLNKKLFPNYKADPNIRYYSVTLNLDLQDEIEPFEINKKEKVLIEANHVADVNITETAEEIIEKFDKLTDEVLNKLVQKEEKSVKDNTFLGMIKRDSKAVCYRQSSEKGILALQTFLSWVINNLNIPDNQKEGMIGFIQGDVGMSLLSCGVGFGLAKVPSLEENEMAQTLADNFRVNGMNNAINVGLDKVIELGKEPAMDLMAKAMSIFSAAQADDWTKVAKEVESFEIPEKLRVEIEKSKTPLRVEEAECSSIEEDEVEPKKIMACVYASCA